MLLTLFTIYASVQLVHTILWSVLIPDTTIWFISYIFRYNSFGGPALYVVHSNGVNVYTFNGDLIWRLNTSTTPIVQHIFTTDYKTDIIVCDGNIVSRRDSSNGQVVWQKVLGSQITALYSYEDVNNDGTWDVLVGDSNGNVYVLNGVNGNIIWSKNLGASPVNGVSFLRISNTLGVVAYAGKGPSKVDVYLQDGTLLWSKSISSGISIVFWPRTYIATYFDLNADGYDEIALITDSAIMAFNGRTGDELWTKALSVRPHTIWRVSEDLDGDGIYDLIVGTRQGIYAVSSASGSTVWYLNLNYISFIDPYYQDIDKNGYSNAVVASDNLYIIDLKQGNITWTFNEISPTAVQLTWITGSFNRNQVVVGSGNGDLVMIALEATSETTTATTITRTITITETTTATQSFYFTITNTVTFTQPATITTTHLLSSEITRTVMPTLTDQQVTLQTYLIAFAMIVSSTIIALLIRRGG
ncbi:MAG: PQQ-binding-like beta-propeller repeat protein [Zestosphaera sp.]